MGAIIRKGGFGMPLLISIGFFVSFIFLNLLFEKLAESFVLPATLAAWMPIFILTPVAILLTYQAMSDKQIISFDRISNFFSRLKTHKWVKVAFGSGAE
jgi:lipopolysaccharide export system permease protein